MGTIHIHSLSETILSDLEQKMCSIEELHQSLKKKITELDRGQLQSVRITADCLEIIKAMYADTHDIFEKNKIG